MSQKIVISGYYGFGNTGDEAVLDGIIASLREVVPDAQITVLSINPERTAHEHPGVKAVHRYRLIGLVNSVRSADLVISGGGSLLQDVTSRKSVLYYLFILKLAHFLKRKTMIFAQGIGPLLRSSTRKAVANALGNVDLITVRDNDSKSLLKEIGIKGDVYVAADPSFLVPPDYAEADRLLAENGLERGNFIAVALRPWPGFEQNLEIAAKSISDASKKLGIKIAALPLQETEDIEPSNLLSDAIVLTGLNNIRVMKGIVGRSGLIIGMRLHSLIFAASEGVPFVPIVYDPKVESFAKSCGIEAAVKIESLSDGAFQAVIEEAWNERQAVAYIIMEKKSALKQNALLSGSLAQRVFFSEK